MSNFQVSGLAAYLYPPLIREEVKISQIVDDQVWVANEHGPDFDLSGLEPLPKH